ncbi:U-scoloptoxin(16)-Er9a-like [Homalodisca vitripennis]|uniref:U-scoloptoxin(16)-Er9a-like n=1 Tax=Homalodisca vitripennis TaxID=197043 RepID=UPI001EEACC5C|nr:U-scoloptoxin(16)-Er9a-like [Homalodisca vitripennis]
MSFFVCVLLALLTSWRVFGFEDFAHTVVYDENGCLVNGKLHKVGEQWSNVGQCYLYTCNGRRGISAVACPLIFVPDNSGCTLMEEDLTKPYPDCCPTYSCMQENNV